MKERLGSLTKVKKHDDETKKRSVNEEGSNTTTSRVPSSLELDRDGTSWLRRTENREKTEKEWTGIVERRERENSTVRNEANKEGLIVSGIVKWARVGLGEESSGHRGHILRVHAFYSKSTIVLWVSHTHKPVVGSRSSLHARTHCVHHSTQTRAREVTRVRTRSRIYWPCYKRSWGWSLDLIKSSKFIYSLLLWKY